MLATGGPAPPERLLGAIERRSRAAGRSPRRPAGEVSPGWAPSRFRWGPAVALGSVAALAIVIAIVIGGVSASPSITSAAKLAYVPGTGPAPTASSAHYLDFSYGGVTFPNYAKLHATPTGQITNRIGGRRAFTVFYRLNNGARLSYTVFSGRPVGLPAAARLVRVDGVPLRTYRTSDGLSVVTLVRHGRTCVLAARTPQSVVLGLAAEPVLVQPV